MAAARSKRRKRPDLLYWGCDACCCCCCCCRRGAVMVVADDVVSLSFLPPFLYSFLSLNLLLSFKCYLLLGFAVVSPLPLFYLPFSVPSFFFYVFFVVFDGICCGFSSPSLLFSRFLFLPFFFYVFFFFFVVVGICCGSSSPSLLCPVFCSFFLLRFLCCCCYFLLMEQKEHIFGFFF